MSPSLHRNPLRLLLLILSLSVAVQAAVDLRLAPLFCDHAVLQQGKAVPVWGWANPGEKVQVEFKGNKAEAVADQTGRWQADLPALTADAQPAELRVKAEKIIIIHDVVIGEVWIASGQSNMEFALDKADNGSQEIASADSPLIRQFKVARAVSDNPADETKGAWEPALPKNAGRFSAVAYFFAKSLYQDLNVPIGIINSTWGGTFIEAWTSADALKKDPAFAAITERWRQSQTPESREKLYSARLAKWEAARAAAEQRSETYTAPKPARATAEEEKKPMPAGLFNGMIQPLIPYAIRGAIWYQGENNSGRPQEYRSLFPTMITDWRGRFGQGNFPFYFVQLPSFQPGNWAGLREAQAQTLRLPNTGMAVTIDLGEVDNLHPTKKQEVGARLARWAKAKTYGKGGVASGPIFKSAVREDSTLRLSFEYREGGLVASKEPLTSFEVAGSGGKFYPATARIDNDTVVVQAGEVAEPVSVRYAWANAPVASLFNKEGLPASPFRFSLP